MLKVFHKYFPIRNLLFFLGEGTLIILGISASAILLQGSAQSESVRASMWVRIVLIAFILQMNLYHLNLYDFSASRKVLDMGLRLIQALGATCLILAGIYAFFPRIILEEQIFLLGLVFLLSFRCNFKPFKTLRSLT
jgi:hypothetical protein